jgi:hypothetical protein
MGLHAFFHRRRTGGSVGSSSYTFPVPTDGLVSALFPDGLVVSGTRVTGWLERVSGKVLPLTGDYLAHDPALGGQPSVVQKQSETYLPAQAIKEGNGLTIVVVSRSQNGGPETMWWTLYDGVANDPVDLFHKQGVYAGLNSFTGNFRGIAAIDTGPATTGGNGLMLTVNAPKNDFNSAGIYLNGQLKPLTSTDQIRAANTYGNLYFGAVPTYTSYGFIGAFSTLLVYNKALDATTINTVHTYLRGQYQL